MKSVSQLALGGLMSVLLCASQAAWAQDDTVDLGDFEVTGMSQEMGMRAIKLALDTPRSSRQEDLDKLVCWFDRVTGSHMTQLYCATNGVLEEAGDFAAAALGGPKTAASSSALRQIRSWSVDRVEFEAALERLGPDELNEEILARAMQGEEPPDNVPTGEEIESFATAMAGVRSIAARYDPRIAGADGAKREELVAESDRMMADAIAESGLTVDRYNEISGLVSRYNSLREMVRERLAMNR